MKNLFRAHFILFALGVIVVVTLITLAGCTPAMTNDEIIAEVEKCRAAGMDAELLRSLSSRDMVQRVECRP